MALSQFITMQTLYRIMWKNFAKRIRISSSAMLYPWCRFWSQLGALDLYVQLYFLPFIFLHHYIVFSSQALSICSCLFWSTLNRHVPADFAQIFRAVNWSLWRDSSMRLQHLQNPPEQNLGVVRVAAEGPANPYQRRFVQILRLWWTRSMEQTLTLFVL